MYIKKKRISNYFFIIVRTSLYVFSGMFLFINSLHAQSDSIYFPGTQVEIGVRTAWYPVRTAAYPPGRLQLKLHNTPTVEVFFQGNFPIGKKGFGLAPQGSVGMIFMRESFVVDSVFVNNAWTDDRFRMLDMGESFFFRLALSGFWQQRVASSRWVLGVSAGMGFTFYVPTEIESFGVDYSMSPHPVNLTMYHVVEINYPQNVPNLLIPLALRSQYLFKNGHALGFSIMAGFSHQMYYQSRYVYARPGHYEMQESQARDIHVGVGLSYLFSLSNSTKK